MFDENIRDIFKRRGGEGGDGRAFWKMVFAALENVDAVELEGFSLIRHDRNHPFAALPLTAAAHGSMQMAIQPDWQAQYQSMFDGKTRGNDRRVERRLHERGELKHRVASAESERLSLLETMLQQKAEQFDLLKITNPYQVPEIVAFYRNLIFHDSKHEVSSLYVSAMLLDERPLAVNFGIVQNDEL